MAKAEGSGTNPSTAWSLWAEPDAMAEAVKLTLPADVDEPVEANAGTDTHAASDTSARILERFVMGEGFV